MAYVGLPRSGPEIEALAEGAEVERDRERASLRQEVEAMEARAVPGDDETRPDPSRRLLRALLRPFRADR